MIGFRFSTSSNFATFERLLKEGLAVNAVNAGRTLKYTILQNISILGPPRSLPGEYPHIDEGDLIRSWDVSTAQFGPHSISVDVYSTDSAAPLLETGTATMEPRPIIVPSIAGNIDGIADSLVAPIRGLS